jgi:hypothetical protein
VEVARLKIDGEEIMTASLGRLEMRGCRFFKPTWNLKICNCYGLDHPVSTWTLPACEKNAAESSVYSKILLTLRPQIEVLS